MKTKIKIKLVVGKFEEEEEKIQLFLCWLLFLACVQLRLYISPFPNKNIPTLEKLYRIISYLSTPSIFRPCPFRLLWSLLSNKHLIIIIKRRKGVSQQKPKSQKRKNLLVERRRRRKSAIRCVPVKIPPFFSPALLYRVCLSPIQIWFLSPPNLFILIIR